MQLSRDVEIAGGSPLVGGGDAREFFAADCLGNQVQAARGRVHSVMPLAQRRHVLDIGVDRDLRN